MNKIQANEPGFVLVPREFLDFLKHAPVSSGVCCCGDEIDKHSDPMSAGHSPVDMWDHALEGWLKQIAAPLVPSPAYGGVREALEPFAKVADTVTDEGGWTESDVLELIAEGGDREFVGSITVGDIRRVLSCLFPVAVEEADAKADEPFNVLDTIDPEWAESFERDRFTPSPQIGKAGAGPVVLDWESRNDMLRVRSLAYSLWHDDQHDCSMSEENRDCYMIRAVLLLAARPAEEPGEVERLTRELAEAQEEIDRLTDENSDLRSEPWPTWATSVLKVIRERSGYDGYDDALDGVDLPAELDECMDELEGAEAHQRTRAETAEADLAETRERLETVEGLVFLADQALMELHGRFPLDEVTNEDRRLKQACKALRAVTGPNHETRNIRADQVRAALSTQESSAPEANR